MFEGFSIFEISEEEHRLVMRGKDEYKEAFDVPNELVKFLIRFIEKADLKVYVFMSYLSLVYNSLWLALLSALRSHQVQAMMNMRQALEAGVRAAYALVFLDRDNFVIEKGNGTLEERNNLKKLCYEWLDRKYPKESKTTKFLKESINKLFSHANLITAQNVTKFSKKKYWAMIFDKEDTLMVKANLWLVANIAFGLIDLFAKVSEETKIINLIPDFAAKMSEYGKRIENIKQDLVVHPRFSRFLK